MRHEDAGLALWLASDPTAGDQTDGDVQSPCREPVERAAMVVSPVRRRAGNAVIALGEWLAGEPHRRSAHRARRGRLAGQAS